MSASNVFRKSTRLQIKLSDCYNAKDIQQLRRHNRSKPCAHEDCEEFVGKGLEYCAKHRNVCASCGKRIGMYSKRCASCATRYYAQFRNPPKQKPITQQMGLGKNPTREQEIRWLIDRYREALARHFYTELCEDAIKKLQAEL